MQNPKKKQMRCSLLCSKCMTLAKSQTRLDLQEGKIEMYLALLKAHDSCEAHFQQLADILQPVRLLQLSQGPLQSDREGDLGQSLRHHHVAPASNPYSHHNLHSKLPLSSLAEPQQLGNSWMLVIEQQLLMHLCRGSEVQTV